MQPIKNNHPAKSEKIIGSRIFTIEDQHLFAEFSGDRNPIHVNPLEARRTISGQCIVHGMNSLLWALDMLALETEVTVNSFDVKFRSSIFLGEKVDCIWLEEENRLSISSNEVILCSIKYKTGPVVISNELTLDVKPTRNSSQKLSFNDCVLHQPTAFSLFGNPALAKKLYPAFSAKYGTVPACELAAISEIVGMQVPGLNSLFLSLKATFAQNQSEQTYSIIKSDHRYETIDISISGSTLTGVASVVFRPTPKSSPSLIELSAVIKKGEFEKVNALIVGGSRGLGEIVAKLIACGGGKSVITYSAGIEEASRLKSEIEDYGESCELLQLTIGRNDAVVDKYAGINQLYYFATPKIFGKRSFNYDENLFNQFFDIYVEGFRKMCVSISKQTDILSVFYPSSVAIDNPLPGLAEYIDAKVQGELLCQELNNNKKNLVLYPRLPRIDTDQTLSLIKVASSDAVEVLLPYMRKMTSYFDASKINFQ